jgi:hypothetical protein
MEERIVSDTTVRIEREPIDPSAYSLSGNHAVPDEVFEETEEIVNWDGGSSDFTMDEIEEKPLSRVDPDDLEFPDPEDISTID